MAAQEQSDFAPLTGTVRGLLLFDVAESIDLSQLHAIIGTAPSKREPSFRSPAPEYVRFERPPVTQHVGVRRLVEELEVEIRIRYFDYGVASVELLIPFCADWQELIRLVNQWVLSPDLEVRARKLLQEALERIRAALRNPYESAWIAEDYYLVQVDPVLSEQGVVTAEELIAQHGTRIAQIVRGETVALSPVECREVLQSSMSYYASDLLVLGWVGAFIYDTRAGASPTFELLEYANTQLLEFRYYDEVLTDVLARVYKLLEKQHSVWARWRWAREANTLNTIRLDFEELVERTDNSIKFLSDMFYARVYRLAAARIGVTDYRNLVTEKLHTARDLYQSMVNEFHQGRAFFLEILVIVILLIEIVFPFIHKG